MKLSSACIPIKSFIMKRKRKILPPQLKFAMFHLINHHFSLFSLRYTPRPKWVADFANDIKIYHTFFPFFLFLFLYRLKNKQKLAFEVIKDCSFIRHFKYTQASEQEAGKVESKEWEKSLFRVRSVHGSMPNHFSIVKKWTKKKKKISWRVKWVSNAAHFIYSNKKKKKIFFKNSSVVRFFERERNNSLYNIVCDIDR